MIGQIFYHHIENIHYFYEDPSSHNGTENGHKELKRNEKPQAEFWDDFDAIKAWWSTGDTTLLGSHYILNNPVWVQHPALPIAIIIAALLICYGFFNKSRQMDYT